MIETDVLAVTPGVRVTLYELDARNLGTPDDLYYFMNDAPSQDMTGPGVVWQGKRYLPLPIQGEGFALAARGEMPRPTLRVAKIDPVMTLTLRRLGYLVGAKLIRRRTLARYLDAANWPGNTPPAGYSPDPSAQFPDEIWIVDRKAKESKAVVEFELASALAAGAIKLPRRQVLADSCGWLYRVWTGTAFDYTRAECPYTGTSYFTSAGTPTTDPALDRCGHRLSDCVLRFGRKDLPFGGFPGAGKV